MAGNAKVDQQRRQKDETKVGRKAQPCHPEPKLRHKVQAVARLLGEPHHGTDVGIGPALDPDAEGQRRQHQKKRPQIIDRGQKHPQRDQRAHIRPEQIRPHTRHQQASGHRRRGTPDKPVALWKCRREKKADHQHIQKKEPPEQKFDHITFLPYHRTGSSAAENPSGGCG